MASIEQQLHDILLTLRPHYIEVINESHLHHHHQSSPHNGQSHFRVVVVSDCFVNQGKMERHRSIYDLCQDLMHHHIHALSIQALTIKDYQELQER